MTTISSGKRTGLGELLAAHRLAAGMTQEELAQRSGVSVRSISDFERGRVGRPRRRSVELLAGALCLDRDEAAAMLASARGLPLPARLPVASAGAAVLPRQLPGDVGYFTGRERELDTLDGWLAAPRAPGAPGRIAVIDGMAGVGKTALAIRWSHRVAAEFPDGQLWADMRGFDPAAEPLSPAEAIRALLDCLQAPGGSVPATLTAQLGLYRSLLAGKRVLVVLDNVRDIGQVRPLVPGTPGCFTIVTSRHELIGLAAADGARLLSLGTFSAADARRLLASRLGADRVTAEACAADQLISRCDGLPLALCIVAARAAARPGLALADLLTEFRAAPVRLGTAGVAGAGTDLRALFAGSYRVLSAEAARLFCLLGLHPGPDVSAAAAGSLAGITRAAARAALAELTSAHVLTESRPGRYALHDLLRAYAQEQAEAHQTPASRRAALRRALDFYLHTAHAAALLLKRSPLPLDLRTPAPGVEPEVLTDSAAALAWYDTERKVLVALCEVAAAAEFRPHAWQLACALAPYLQRRGHWAEGIAILSRAARIAADGDPGSAYLHLYLGRFHLSLDQDQDVRVHFRLALDGFSRQGNQLGQADTHQFLAKAFERAGDYGTALEHSQQAYQLYRSAGHLPGEAGTLNGIGWLHACAGRYEQALTYCEQALDLQRADAGLSAGAAETWDSIGYSHFGLGAYARALGCYQRALALHRAAGDRYYVADTLVHLGDAHHALGSQRQARDCWQQALDILTELRHRDVTAARSRLRAHPA